jgi:hypothetical protein
MTMSAKRSWLWIAVVVLSGLCSGVSGLYTGASITAARYEDRIQQARVVYEKHMTELQTNHQQELERLDKNSLALTQAIAALSGKVNGVVDTVSQVNQKVDSVSTKVDQTADTTAKTHAAASQAIRESKLLAAKTDVLTAKVENAASAPKTIIIRPNVPDAPANGQEWWHGSAKK